MKKFNSNDYKKMYESMWIDTWKLWCIMLDLEPIKHFDISEEFLYSSKNKDRYWIDGMIYDKIAHITLLYWLMESWNKNKKHIDDLLEGINLDNLVIESIGKFDSNQEDEEYYCIVAHIKKTPELLEAHAKLELLPHINTFPEYKPHMTIAYIKKDDKVLEYLLHELKSLEWSEVKAKWINYGKE